MTLVMTLGRKVQAFRAFRHRDFRWFWFGAVAQATGMGTQFLILSWFVLELTGSASRMGFAIFLFGMTGLVVVSFTGTFADRFDRRNVCIVTQALVALFLTCLAVLGSTDRIALWHLYVGVVLMASSSAFNAPARAALVPDLVDRGDVMNAVLLNAAVMNAGRVIGPLVGGVVIEFAGIGPALYMAAGLYGIASLTLLMVRRVSRTVSVRKTSFVADLLTGIRYCWSNPVTFTVIAIGFIFGFFGLPYILVMPAFASQVLEANAGQVGVLMSGAGIGSLVGTLFLASLGDFRHKNWLLLICMFLFGISLFCLALSPWFWLSWVILLFLGLSDIFPMGTTVLQLSVPPELRGRVMSLWIMTVALSMIGSFPMALVADYKNWPTAFAGGSAICLIAGLILGILRPTLRRLAL